MNLFTNNELGSSGRRNFFVFSGVFLIIIVLAGGGYAVWNRYFSSEAQTQRNYQKYVDWQANYDKAMREDTYGGKTPQETLDMFVAALRAGDVELASKYFMLDTNEQGYNVGNYLTRNKIVKSLTEEKQKNKLQYIADVISNAVSDPSGPTYDGDYGFVVYEGGEIVTEINMELNDYSGVWKIESL